MSPLMTEAVEVGRAALARKARPWTIRPADFFCGPERARALFARLIGADADGVALVPAASYGLATAAANLPLRAGQTRAGGRRTSSRPTSTAGSRARPRPGARS